MRPYIICHMGTSIDGRLHPSRFTVPASGIPADVLRGHYEKIHDRLVGEGWIVGRKTMAEMAKGHEKPIADAPRRLRNCLESISVEYTRRCVGRSPAFCRGAMRLSPRRNPVALDLTKTAASLRQS
jgi:hypothetical protein